MGAKRDQEAGFCSEVELSMLTDTSATWCNKALYQWKLDMSKMPGNLSKDICKLTEENVRGVKIFILVSNFVV